MTRWTLTRRFMFMILGSVTAAAFAQETYPDRPIRIVVPYAIGGNTDVLARLYAQKLTEVLKTPVVVENKAGSGSVLGSEAVAKAQPDGYTLLFGTSSHTINATLFPKLPYDSQKDFTYIAVVAEVPMVLSVHPSVPAKTPKELVALMKAKPGKFTYASSGNGSSLHMAVELLKFQEQVSTLHIPYRGAGPALTDTVAGQVDFIIDPVTTSAPFINAGKLRALAVTTSKRSPVLPDVPTLQEAGFPKYETSTWNMVMAPSKTPAPVVAKLSGALLAVSKDAGFTKRLADIGAVSLHMTPAQTAGYVDRQTQQWARVIRGANIRPE